MASQKRFNVAVVGATGAVGTQIIKILEQRNFPIRDLKLLASGRSAGTELSFNGDSYMVEELYGDSFENVDIALFSAGGSVSKEFAPIAADSNAVVIDNTSAFRMNEDVPLVVPE
ncbi:MAG: aspartate-semialdehyde dehydrogenase, partial [Nitrospinota bacterium]